jgi:uncharacterized iron-regulated protein
MKKTLLAATLDQTRTIERCVTVMGLEAIAFEGSDRLVAPASIAR